MDNTESNKDSARTSKSDMKHPSSNKGSESIEKSDSGPTVLLFWVWNWFANLPKTVSNMYTDFKNSAFLAKFSVIDAMLQFIFAVATSCHPQDDGFDGEEYKNEKQQSPVKPRGDLKVFGGSGKTLRSRTVEAAS